MKYLIFLTHLFLFASEARSQDTRPRKWYDERMALMDSIADSPQEEQIIKLGNIVGPVGTNYRMDDEQKEVFERARALLLTIPGHAEYYANRINEARLHFEKNDMEGEEFFIPRARARSKLLDEQQTGFQVLMHLPSSETVRVLGQMLTDERGRAILTFGNNYLSYYHRWLQRPNSVHAAQALQKLPLKNKPHAPPAHFDDKEPPREWINWYTQIKEGRRTFSFEGDPNEYDLNGPVRAAKNPDTPRMSKRDAVSDQSDGDSSSDSPSNKHLPWIISLGIALSAFAGYLFKRRMGRV